MQQWALNTQLNDQSHTDCLTNVEYEDEVVLESWNDSNMKNFMLAFTRKIIKLKALTSYVSIPTACSH